MFSSESASEYRRRYSAMAASSKLIASGRWPVALAESCDGVRGLWNSHVVNQIFSRCPPFAVAWKLIIIENSYRQHQVERLMQCRFLQHCCRVQRHDGLDHRSNRSTHQYAQVFSSHCSAACDEVQFVQAMWAALSWSSFCVLVKYTR